MKQTTTDIKANGIKVTRTHTIDADGIERITTSASIKKNDRLLLAQKVWVNTGEGFKPLYTRSQNGKTWKWRELFTWIRLGMYLENPEEIVEEV